MKSNPADHPEQDPLPATTGRAFASVEELLRFDAARVVPPPALAARIQETLAAGSSPPKRPWWRRWFSAQ